MKRIFKHLSLYILFTLVFTTTILAQTEIVEKNGKYGVINKNGTIILKYTYDSIHEYDIFGFFEVSRNDSSFLVDQFGVEYYLVKEINKLNEKVEALELDIGKPNRIPEEIFKFKQLKILCLKSNDLDSIPLSIQKLKNLKYIDFSENNLKKLPAGLINLTKLEYINLSYNLFLNIPETIFKLSKLRGLNLSENMISVLPPEIKYLKLLKILILGRHPLKSIPSELWFLENMEILSLSGGLKEIPSEISNLSRLQILVLVNNKFKKLSLYPLVKLEHLWYLQLDENKITKIGPEVGELKQLVSLGLYSNKLKRLPKEISTLEKLEWIFLVDNYFFFWQKLRTKRLLPNCEVKFDVLEEFRLKK